MQGKRLWVLSFEGGAKTDATTSIMLRQKADETCQVVLLLIPEA